MASWRNRQEVRGSREGVAVPSDGRVQPLGSSLRPAPTASRGLQAPANSSLPKNAASSQRPLPPPSCSAVSLPPSRRPLLCLSRCLILSLPPQHGCSSQEHQAPSLLFLHPGLREFGAFPQCTISECSRAGQPSPQGSKPPVQIASWTSVGTSQRPLTLKYSTSNVSFVPNKGISKLLLLSGSFKVILPLSSPALPV